MEGRHRQVASNLSRSVYISVFCTVFILNNRIAAAAESLLPSFWVRFRVFVAFQLLRIFWFSLLVHEIIHPSQ